MNRFKTYLYTALAAAVLGALLMWKACVRQTPPPQSGPAVLKPGETHLITIDPRKRRIETVTKKGVRRIVLPDAPTNIRVREDGDVDVYSPQFGYQTSPFLGYGSSGVWRLYLGCDLFYFKDFDLGAGLSFRPNGNMAESRVFGVLSYNVWSNIKLGVGFDHTGQVNGLISVRL